jgi:UDP-perosamine 4-acetyltransferase
MRDSNLLIIGAGGHARSVLDIALQNGDYSAIECVDPSYPRARNVEGLVDIPIIGTDADMEKLFEKGYRNIFVALGENRLRHKLFHHALSIGFEPVNIISRNAVISPRTRFGKGICVMAGAVINVNTIIEDNCIVNTRCSIDHDCHIKQSSHIAPGVTLSGYVKIEQGVWIGTGASIIDKVIVGEWSYIGAGAAVVKDIESDTLYYGVPAKKVKPLP